MAEDKKSPSAIGRLLSMVPDPRGWALQRLGAMLPPSVQEFSRRHLARYTPNFLVWSAATGLFTFMVVMLLGRIFFAGGNLSGQAIEAGQRVLIPVATGEVEGNARHTNAAPGKTPAAAPQDTQASAMEPGKEGLNPAPLEALSEQTHKGLLPKIGKDGTMPWRYYARPVHLDGKRPMVAVVLTDLGLSKPLTEEAFKLPHNFSLSFSPYSGDARKWAMAAREQGFETLVDLPMQSVDYARNGIDPGPYGLMEGASPDENDDRLDWVLSRFPGYIGVLAPANESPTSNPAVIRPALTELAAHGVLFLYVKTEKNAALADLIKSRQFYALGIDKVIDDDIAPGPIGKQLGALTALAKLQGMAIGFAHTYPPTLEALMRWSDTLNAQGIDLVPVSAIGMKVLP